MKSKVEAALGEFVDVPKDFEVAFAETVDVDSEYKRHRMARYLREQEG